MNGNPIFNSYRSQMLYAGIWIIVALLQTALSATGLFFAYALIDSVIFNSLFALCIIPLWYPVRFNQWELRTWRFNVAAHFALASIVIFVWLLVGYSLGYLIGAGNDEYMYFLNVSIRWKTLEGLLFYVVGILAYYLYIHIEQLKEKAANEIRLNKLIRDAELNMLKSQINPHFLFNSMNSVNSLILRNPEQAQMMLVALSDYLRYAVMATNSVYSRVAGEMDNIARYLSIEKLRFGDKLLYEPDIDPSCLNAEIPAMLLQPLFENAIKHGVYESLETVRIAVKITKEGQYLVIRLSNDFDEEGVSRKKGSGTGLQNIRERLRLLYGASATMQAKTEGSVFTVTLKINYEL